MKNHERPEFVTEAMLEYLDDLREIVRINMFGAAPYLVRDFGLKKDEAKDVLFYWMASFDQRHPL